MDQTDKTKWLQQVALLFSTCMIAICGLIYELLAGTLSSYLLGDSVYQFSLVIGLFMSSMGLGAWLSRFIDTHLPTSFVNLQLLIALLGGLTAPILFFAFAIIDNYAPFLFVLVLFLGSLLGIEIPLIIRILKQHFSLKLNVSNVFTADYIGALIAALLFPLVLVPQLGLMQTGFLFGILNAVIAVMTIFVFKNEITHKTPLFYSSAAVLLVLLIGLFYANTLTTTMENKLYQDEVVYANDTPFQRLVLTKRGKRTRFYINGALQFDSADEYRYHESLIHPAMMAADHTENILILGGGDGLAVRELLQYNTIKKITVVDLDPAVTQLFKHNEGLLALNKQSLLDPKVEIINRDAWKFLQLNQDLYDVIFIDLPDPNNPSLSRLYTTSFYKLVKQHLALQGVMVTQATSPLYAREAFWSIESTLSAFSDEGSWSVLPYHMYIPSFGEWGFVMASQRTLLPEEFVSRMNNQPINYRFLDAKGLISAFHFSQDMSKIPVKVNKLSDHVLLDYYQKGWEAWYKGKD